MRHPDNPKLVSLDFLKRIDADPPGTWIAQPKYDGWRRTAWNVNGRWIYQAKHKTGPAARPMPKWLQDEFESIGFPKGTCIDMEWMGPRGHCSDMLYIFDMLQWDGFWSGRHSFGKRYVDLCSFLSGCDRWPPARNTVRLAEIFYNPGLCDRFLEQMQDDKSEGLVIRRADSGLVGGLNGCKDNPHWFKVKFSRVEEMVRA